jgi:excisionase family DNA binding protein
MAASFAPTESDRWLTVREAADARSLSYRRVIEWIRVGLLPSSQPGGGQHLVHLIDLDALLMAGYKPATRGPLARRKV